MYFISCGLYQLRPQQETWYIQSKLSCQRKTEKILPPAQQVQQVQQVQQAQHVQCPNTQNQIFNATQLKLIKTSK